MDIFEYAKFTKLVKESGGSGGSADDRVKYVTYMDRGAELIKYPVIEGDTARDPVAKGYIEKPTKEPTESKVYPFGGWSKTDGGAPDSTALQNVTEDRTVYAAFTESVRTYTVNFYDGDTLVHTEQVAYGGSSSYTIAKEGYIFSGWSPAPTNVTADMDCYAQWIEGVDFATAEWSKIAEIAESGKASEIFNIGDTRTATINGADATIEIIGFDHDDLADGTGKAGITMWVRNLNNIVTGKSTNTTFKSENAYDWTNHSSYAQLLTLIDSFESELAAVVKTIRKPKYSSGYDEVKVFPISMKELGCKTGNIEGTCYGKFTSGKSTGTDYDDITLKLSYFLRDGASNANRPSIVKYYSTTVKSRILSTAGSGETAYPSVCFCI